jgi:hypothetical protein
VGGWKILIQATSMDEALIKFKESYPGSREPDNIHITEKYKDLII